MANRNKKVIRDPKYSKIFGNIGQSMERSGSEDLRAQRRADNDFNINRDNEFSNSYTQANYDGFYGDSDYVSGSNGSDTDIAFLDGWRYLNQLKFQTNMTEDMYDIANANERIEVLNGFKDFVSKYQQYQKVVQDFENAKKSGNNILARKLDYDLRTKYGNINQEKSYWDEQCKKSPTLRNIMYDRSGLGDEFIAAARTSWENLKEGFKSIGDASLEDVGKFLIDEPLRLLSVANPTLAYTRNKYEKQLQNKISQGRDKFTNLLQPFIDANTTDRAIEKGLMNDRLKGMQVYNIDKLDNAASANLKTVLDSQIEDNKQALSDAQANFVEHKQRYLTGGWWFDPTKITKAHRARFDNANPSDGIQSFFDSLPQIGSSISSLYSMGGQMGLSWLGNAAIEAAPHPMVKAGLWLGTTLGQLALSSYMRQEETSSEVMDAWMQRVQDLSIKNNIDLNSVLNKTKEFCKNVGVNTEGLDEQELLRLALAYNVHTGDKIFDNIKKNTRAGLKKVEDLNNALSTKDYLEVAMWNPLGGVGKNIKRYSEDFILKRQLSKGLNNPISDNVLNSAKYTASLNRIGNESVLNNIRTVGSNITNRIAKLASKLPSSTWGKVATYNLAKGLASHGGKLISTAALEGIEEGQQAMIQDRYKRGLYDNYVSSGDFADNQYTPYIDPLNFLEDGKIGLEAASAYFGLNPTDPLNGDPELKRQMNIGASTSIFFAVPHAVVGNITKSPNSLRGYISQFKNDKNLIRRIANNYKAQGNEEQVGMFFDAYRNGHNYEQVKRSYDGLKAIRNPQTITDEDISEDLEMAQAAYGIYKRTKNKKDATLDDLHIDRDSDDHREFVKHAVSVGMYYREAAKSAEDSNKALQNATIKFKNDFLKNLEVYQNDSMAFEGSDIQKKLMNYFVQSYDLHKKNNNDKRIQLSEELKTLQEQYDNEKDDSKKEELQKKIDEKQAAIDNIKDISLQTYATGVFNTLQQFRELRALEKLEKQLKNQHSHLSVLKRISDNGVNTANIAGMRNSIRKQIAELKAKFSEITKNASDEDKAYFYEISKYAAAEAASVDGYTDAVSANALNQAIVDALTPKWMAYNLGWVSPEQAKNAYSRVKWEYLTDDQQEQYKQSYARKARAEGKTNDEIANIDYAATWEQENKDGRDEIDTLIKQYRDIRSKYNTEEGGLPEEDNNKLFDIQKKLANILIKQDLAERIRRKKENEDYEESNSPVTQDDIDRAEDGDEKAKQKLEKQAAEDQSTTDKDREKSLKDVENTQDPNDVREQLGLQRADQPTEQQKTAASRINAGTNQDLKNILQESGATLKEETNLEQQIDEEEQRKQEEAVLEEEKQSESERLAQIAAEEEKKRQFFEKANEFVNSEEFYDEIKGRDLSTLLQEKFNVPKEWADEFAENQEVKDTVENLLTAKDLFERITNALEYIIKLKEAAKEIGYGLDPVTHQLKPIYNTQEIQKIIKDLRALIRKYPTYKNPINFIKAADKMLSRIDDTKKILSDIIDDTYIIDEDYESKQPIKEDVPQVDDSKKVGNNENTSESEDNNEETDNEGGNEHTVKDEADASIGNDTPGWVVKTDNDDTPQVDEGSEIEGGFENNDSEDEDTFDFENSTVKDSVTHIIDRIIAAQFEKINKEENAKDIEDLTNYICDLTDTCSDPETLIDLVKKHPSYKKLQSKSDIFTNDLTDALGKFFTDYPILQDKTQYATSSETELPMFDIIPTSGGPVVTYKGIPVNPLDLMMMGVEDFGNEVSPQESEQGKAGNTKDEIERSVGVTFMYQPNSMKPMEIKCNKKDLLSDKTIAPGLEFAKKLQIPGWIKRVKKTYYIVHGNDLNGNGTTADKLSVTLVMQDPDNSDIVYCCSLRRTDNTYSYTQDHKNPYRNENFIGTDYEYIIESLGSVGVDKKLFDQVFTPTINALLISVQSKDPSVKTIYDLKRGKYAKEYWDTWDRIRKQNTLPGRIVYTYSQILDNIAALRAARQQIIDAYCDTRVTKDNKIVYVIPETRREDVTPKEVLQSNGSLNNVVEDGNHIYRSIVGEDAGFGLSSNIDELNQQVESGQIEIGVGTGPLGVVPGPNQIRSINSSSDAIPGRGRAGKVYITIPEENCPGTQGDKVVIQLHEQRFGKVFAESNIDEGIDQSGNMKGDIAPSTAEILFRLVTKTINPDHIIIKNEQGFETTITYEQLDALCNLVLNNGTKTLIGKVTRDSFGNVIQNDQNKINILCHKLGFYSDKQICFVEKEGHSPYLLIGDRVDGAKTLSKFTLAEMFPSQKASDEVKQKAELIRKHVIALIAQNMHWNTNVDMMTNIMPEEIYDMLESAFYTDDTHERRNINTFSPFGDQLISFDHDDFFNEDGSRKNTTVLAWMLKTNKLTTDVGTNKNDMVKDPYVFANGVNAPVKPVIKPKEKEETKKKADKKQDKKNTDKETKPKAIVISTEIPSGNKGFVIDEKSNRSLITYDEKASKEDKIKQVLSKIEALEKQGLKIEGKEKITEMLKNGKAVQDLGALNVILFKKTDGYKILVISKTQKTTKINGLYSTQDGGDLNIQEARNWLKAKLGLSDQQIIVTNGVVRVLENGKNAYGATRTAADILSGGLFGHIELSKKAGEGIQYHEAWHYVNMLIHNPAMRLKLYREFTKSHPELKSKSVGEIEEFMADDFRAYMERRLDKKLSTRLERYFNNIWQFLKAMVGFKNNVYFTYRAIARGKYKNKPYNEASITDFQNKYGEIYYSIKDDNGKTIQFQNIDNYRTYYACAKYLTNIAIESLDLTTIDKIKSLSIDKLNSVFDKINDQIAMYEDDEDSEYMVGLLKDIIENKEGFKNVILQMLKSFSIEGKQAKSKIEQEHAQNIDDGTICDNIWDIDHMSVSRKLNMGFAAKIFFSTLPKLRTNGLDEKNRIIYETETDPIFGSTEYIPFGQVWNKILNNLYTCDSFDDKDEKTNEYLESSLVGQIKRLKESDPFFESVYRKIEPLIDDEDNSISVGRKLELKTQILGTIHSYKVGVTGGEFNTKQEFSATTGMSQEQLQEYISNQQQILQAGGTLDDNTKKVQSDISKAFNLPDTNHLQSKYALARDWSINFASGTGAVIYSNGHSILNPQYVDKIISLYNNAVRLCEKQQRKTEKLDNYVETTVDQAKDAVIQLYSALGIPLDKTILDRLVHDELQNSSKTEKRTQLSNELESLRSKYDEEKDDKKKEKLKKQIDSKLEELNDDQQYKQVLRDMIKGADVTSALKIVNWLSSSRNKTEISKSTKSKKQEGVPFDQIYKGYATTDKRGKLPWIGKIAVAYAETYPSGSEMSVTGADGAQIYPINMNNEVSDKCTALCENRGGIIDDYKKSSYAQHSILLQVAEAGIRNKNTSEDKIRLNVLSYFKNKDTGESVDYFGMTAMEDYIMKMILTFNKRIIFPTMADKKTWYSITAKQLSSIMNNDLIIPFEMIKDEDGVLQQEDLKFQQMRLGSKTLNTFYGYFVDELNSLIEYYSKENIERLKHNQHKLLVNFHGKFVTEDPEEFKSPDGKYRYTHMNFDGNGGKFRYFYDAVEGGEKGKEKKLNGNAYMEYLYKKELAQNKLYIQYGQYDKVTDGFESIRNWLDGMRVIDDSEKSIGIANTIKDKINSVLMARVHDEFLNISDVDNPSFKVLKRIEGGKFKNIGIPEFMIKSYSDEFAKKYPDMSQENREYAALVSLITNHVVRTQMSIIETEKIFTGDPAMYKWKNFKFDSLPDDVQKHYTRTVTVKTEVNENGKLKTKTHKETFKLSVLQLKDVDKIKRLGGVLSPGTNLRTTYSKKEMDLMSHNNRRKDLAFGTDKYTFMNTSDIHAVSRYLKEVSSAMTQQQVVDALQRALPQNEMVAKMKDFLKLSGDNVTATNVIYAIYRYDDVDKLLNQIEKILGKDVVNEIKQNVQDSTSPYRDITVSDAQVCVRPAMYRRLRIAMGEWTFEKDEDGYCDEDAYNIIEGEDESWMYDESKYNKVRKFILKPLKMSYFQNKTNSTISSENILLPIYNKMAMFPMFKFACQSDVGKAIYERMNRKGAEIDMLGFESAVKVGCNQKMFTPYKEGVDTFDNISETLNKDSSVSIDYTNGKENHRINKQKQTASNYPSSKQDDFDFSDEINAVQVQSMNDLHLQLNTDPHEALERAVGTQMFKICFSNIVGNMLYGQNSIRGKGRKGYEIRNDIMNIVNAMTQKGVDEIRHRFFTKDKKGKYVLDKKQVDDYVLSICKNNGLGEQAEQIIKNGGIISALQSRQVFEHSISSLVNKKVIDITTNGGAAVQQSCFGFEGFNKKTVIDQKQAAKKGLPVLNNGNHLKWYKNNGSMEIILSLNFFRHVVPKNYQKTPQMMREWLIENDIIKGVKKNGMQNNPKPFGIGYRIPTQGMSSIFTFTVADVLPEMSGDVIIVPTEFTAQTGSDFDVDKLYLATYSYDQGDDTSTRSKLKSSDRSYQSYTKESKAALRNALLDNYADIISDYKNISDARASIDVLTNKLKSEIVPLLQDNTSNYAKSMYELLPSFQARRKMEYSVGKDGIGPFALNVTNLALTQYCQLGLNFDNITKSFGFGNIDDIKGRDHMYISAWLSAMVNAHVDVAKDPYILTLNVNQATYKYVNLLLRCGMGESTFTFIAQPYLRRFADKICNGKGLYGRSLEGNTIQNVYENGVIGDLKNEAFNNFITYYNLARSKNQIDDTLEKVLDMFEVKYNKYVFKSKARQLFYELPQFNLFNRANASQYLKKPHDQNDSLALAKFYIYQFAVCDYLSTSLSKPAQALSDLVRMSRIDTKKFGNNIISQLNFLNSYQQFKNGNANSLFTLHGISKESKKIATQFKPYTKEQQRVINTRNVLKRFVPERVNFQDNVTDFPKSVEKLLKDNDIDIYTMTLHDLLNLDLESISNKDGKVLEQISQYLKAVKLAYDTNDLSIGMQIPEMPTREPVDNMDELQKEANEKLAIKYNYYTEYPLHYYFNKTFLDKKLRCAIDLNQELLSNQTLVAQPIFKKLYMSLMASIFGTVEYNVPYIYKDKDGKYKIGEVTKLAYTDVMNDDKAVAIGRALETIMRHRSFLYQSLQEKSKEVGIDLTCNGDENAAFNKMKTLLFGSDNEKSLAERLEQCKTILINKYNSYSNKNKIPDYIRQLFDDNGKLQNDFLNVVKGFVSEDKTQPSRVVLNQSAINMDQWQKSKISAAIEELRDLSTISQDKEDQNIIKAIKRLLDDLIFYSYYSTYNNGGVNQFFDMCPVDEIHQYTDGVSKAVTQNKNTDALISFIINDYSGKGQLGEYNLKFLMDLIFKNFWNNKDIVKEYTKLQYMSTSDQIGKTVYKNGHKVDSYVVIQHDNVNGNFIESVIALPNQLNPQPYLLIKQGKQNLLYQMTGYVNKIIEKSNGDVKKVRVSNIYRIINKLGNTTGRNKQYEFFENDTYSMYPQNNISVEVYVEQKVSKMRSIQDDVRTILSNLKYITLKDLINTTPENLISQLKEKHDMVKKTIIDNFINHMTNSWSLPEGVKDQNKAETSSTSIKNAALNTSLFKLQIDYDALLQKEKYTKQDFEKIVKFFEKTIDDNEEVIYRFIVNSVYSKLLQNRLTFGSKFTGDVVQRDLVITESAITSRFYPKYKLEYVSIRNMSNNYDAAEIGMTEEDLTDSGTTESADIQQGDTETTQPEQPTQQQTAEEAETPTAATDTEGPSTQEIARENAEEEEQKQKDQIDNAIANLQASGGIQMPAALLKKLGLKGPQENASEKDKSEGSEIKEHCKK